jgi:outer membrane protein assembly factor BamB
VRIHSQRSGKVRTVLVVLGLVAVITLGIVVVTNQWAVIQNYFDQERENTAALQELQRLETEAKPGPPAEAGWPQWRGPNRDGVAPKGPFRTNWNEQPPTKLWSVPGGGGYASIVVVDGRAYSFDLWEEQERLRCLDAQTGAELWSQKLPTINYDRMRKGYASGPRSTPTIHDGKLYAVGATGRFVCYEIRGVEPKLLWYHELVDEFEATLPDWGMASSPLIEGDLVIVQPGGKAGTIAAFERISGELRWANGSEPNGYSSPIAATLDGVRQIVAVTGESIIGIGPSDGQRLWSQPWLTRFNGNIATPIILAGRYVFVSSDYNKGCTLLQVTREGDGARVDEVYFRKNRVMRNHHSTSVVLEDHLYGADQNELKCVSWKTGEVVEEWYATTDEGRTIGKSSLIRVENYLVGLTESGSLFLAAANPKEFVFLGQVPNIFSGRDNWACPVVVDGCIYLRDGQSIVCYEAKP